MADLPSSPRRYDEAEVGKILKRATEIQETHRAPRGTRAGMSIEELEEIAREVGIDTTHLRRAARELDVRTPGGGPVEDLVGGPLSLVRERTVAGEMPEEGFEAVVMELQRLDETHGQPSMLGRTLTWRSETATKTRTLQVVVSSRNGKTEIRAEERLHQFASGLFGGTVAGAGLGVGLGVGLPVGIEVLGSVLFSVAFPLGIVGLSYLVARGIYRQITQRRVRYLEDLMDALIIVVEDSIQRALPPTGGGHDMPPPHLIP
jgi:hypothetical protein